MRSTPVTGRQEKSLERFVERRRLRCPRRGRHPCRDLLPSRCGDDRAQRCWVYQHTRYMSTEYNLFRAGSASSPRVDPKIAEIDLSTVVDTFTLFRSPVRTFDSKSRHEKDFFLFVLGFSFFLSFNRAREKKVCCFDHSGKGMANC